MKWYAIKNPSGEWVEDAVSTEAEQAWEYAFDVEDDLFSHPEMTMAEVGEAAGYCCVEVELAEPGTADALRRAREAWAVIVRIRSHIEADARHFEEQAAALATLHEVLTRVTDTAAGEGGNA